MGIWIFEAMFALKEKSGFQYGIVEVEEYNFEPLVSCQKKFGMAECYRLCRFIDKIRIKLKMPRELFRGIFCFKTF